MTITLTLALEEIYVETIARSTRSLNNMPAERCDLPMFDLCYCSSMQRKVPAYDLVMSN